MLKRLNTKAYRHLKSMRRGKTCIAVGQVALIHRLMLKILADGISRISKAQAQQMHNKTVPIPGEPGSYIVGLDVFHQLHCLVSYFGHTSSELYH